MPDDAGTGDASTERGDGRAALMADFRHDLRTRLNAIIGYSEMLLEDADRIGPGDAAGHLEKIHTAGSALLALVNYLLDPANMEGGKLGQDVESLWAQLSHDIRDPLNVIIGYTEMLIEDITTNVEGSFVVDLQRIRLAGQRLLSVAEAAANSWQLGSEGAATRRLPQGAPPASETTDTTTEIPHVDEPNTQNSERGTLLVVDDDVENREILSRYLGRRGHSVITAAGGHDALAALSEHTFDLVLLDIVMPGMDGFQILERLKSDNSIREVPVIFISALDDTQGKVRAFKAGGVDYITIPFHAEEVAARVENQLKISRLQKELERRNRELAKKSREMAQAQERTDLVFSALANLLPGTVLDDKYRLDEKIGAGGVGAVFRATHLSLNRPVAVKVFRPTRANDTPTALKRFRMEGVLASRITHPNAVKVLDYGISPRGIAYLVMELLHGRALSHELHEKGKLSFARCMEIVVPVSEALAEAHSLGVVHRDIKPSNIFLHQTTEGEVVKVVDFGLAKMTYPDEGTGAHAHTESLLTGPGAVVGTLPYMSPEQIQGTILDGRSDVYSLGIVWYEMLSGRRPFESREGAPYAVALMHLTEEPPPLRGSDPTLPVVVETIVRQTLMKDRDMRPTARELSELARALKAVAALRAPDRQSPKPS
jgi:serine/threonine protein kinase